MFEILLHVHSLRGTKSRFTYSLPVKEPLSPRSLQAPLQSLSPNIAANPLEDLVSYKSQQPAKNVGVEAREKVLEAIAPMRRGRPQGSAQPSAKGPSRQASPEKPVAFETKFGDDDSDRVWKSGLRASRSGQPSLGHDASSFASKSDTDAWSIASRQSAQKADPSTQRGFDNDFSSSFGSKFTSTQASRSPPTGGKPVDHAPSSFGTGFGDTFDPSKAAASASSPVSSSRPSAPPSQPSRLRQSRIGKDAFDGLALPSQPQAPTLAEARMSRTGLASFGSSSSSSSAPYNVSPPTPSGHGGLGTSNTTYRPPSIHASRPTPSPQLPQSQIQPQSSSLSPIPPPPQSWRQHVKAQPSSQEGLSAEERFPSLEDLDRTFASPSSGAPAEKPLPLPTRPSDRPPSRSSYKGALGTNTGGAASALNAPSAKGRFDGVRSQQVTGTAMREARAANARPSTFLTRTEDGPSRQVLQPLQSRPSLSRKHRSSVSMKAAASAQPEPVDLLTGPSPPSLPSRPPPQDWLTGPDEDIGGMPLGVRTAGLNALPDEQPKLRDSPSKRASFIERSPIALAKPLEAESIVPIVPQQAQIVSSMNLTTELEREWDKALESLDKIPAGKSERERRKAERKRSKSPATTTSTTKPLNTRKDVKASNTTAGLGLQMPSGTGVRQGSAPSPSPGGLTDSWSPVPSPKRRSRSRQDSGSSVSDIGPEDPSGYAPKGGTVEKMKELEKVSAKTGVPLNGTGEGGQRRRRTKSKGRQSSVHELVDLWGGGLEKAKSPTTATAPNKRSSMILSTSGSTMKPPPVTNKSRSSSPQLVTASEPSIPFERPLPSPSKHTKQPSSQPGSRRLPMPPPATSPTASEPPIGRSRPQSMLISPISASRSADMEVPSSTAAAAAFAQQAALSPPGAPRRPQQARRSSISDMVQHYEAIGSLKPPTKGPGPGPPAKPVALQLKTHQSTSSAASADTFSPSAAATRFPKLSPTTSPVLAKDNLAVPEDTGRSQFGRDFAKHRTSPSGLPPRTSPVSHLETPYSAYSSGSSTGAVVNGAPAPSRRSPLPEPPVQPQSQPHREQPPSHASVRQQPPPPMDIALMAPPPSPRVERGTSAQLELPPTNPNVRSPSPEKPYQGVSRLIDRWQRAVDDEGPGRPGRGGGAAKKAGVVGGGPGRS